MTIKKEGPVARPLHLFHLLGIGLGLLFQDNYPFLNPCFTLLTIFRISVLNRRDLVLVKGLHCHIERLVGQVIGMIALPEVYLTGQQEPE